MTSERKSAIEEVARRRKRPIAELLDEAVGSWLQQQEGHDGREAAQERARAAAMRAFGRIAGGDPDRAQQAAVRVRDKLRGQRGRDR